MPVITAIASCEYSIGYLPGFAFINTSDTLAQVLANGYLNNVTLQPAGFLITQPNWVTGLKAKVITTDFGVIDLHVNVDLAGNISLIPEPLTMTSSIATNPSASSTSTLALGTAYQNTSGYDVMLTVYLSITSALSATISLGVGSTSTPTQQTLMSGLTLAALSIVPINIYLPTNYYAKLDISGTISASIAGQIAMPI